VIGVVAGEAAAWLAAGVRLGMVRGLAVSGVMVHGGNAQSVHGTRQLVLPLPRLLLLALAVWLAGTATAALCARHAASRAAVLSVKEDW